MKIVKMVLTLLVAIVSIAASGQDGTLIKKDWLERKGSLKSVKEIVELHKNNKKKLVHKTDLLANDVFAIIAAGDYIAENLNKKIEPSEKQLYSIVKSIDISSKEFASLFAENTFKLNSFFYVKFLSEGEPRELAMGGDLNHDFSYEATDYDYKRIIEVLEKCDVSIREQHCGYLLRDRMDANENLRQITPIIEKQLPDSEYKRSLLKRIKDITPLLKGGKAPDWSYSDRNGHFYSLDDFKGKFLVIDMWATWCGGCIQNLDKYIALKNKFANRDDIQFITISIDKENAYHDWKYALAKYNLMDMVNLITFENSDFEKNYHFTGVPRYLIIDPQGNIVTTSAPSPSSGSFERLVAKTLKEYDATNPLDKMAIEDYNEEMMLPLGSKYYTKYLNNVLQFSTEEKIAKGKEKLKSVIDQTISSIVFNSDPKMFNPKKMIQTTDRILNDYELLSFEKDAKYHYIKALNLMSRGDLEASFDYLKENLFKTRLFTTAEIESMVSFARVALYPYLNLGLEESKISLAKIKELIDVVKNDESLVNYLSGYTTRYENKIKYILTDIEMKKL